MKHYQDEIESEKDRTTAKGNHRAGQPAHGPRRRSMSPTQAGPSKAVRRSVEVDSLTTKNDDEQGGASIGRKRKTTSQPPPSKRRKPNPDKLYSPQNDEVSEDENTKNGGKRNKRNSTASPPSSRRRRGSVYKDSGEPSSDNEDDGKKKGRKRLKRSSPASPPKRQKKDHDGDDEAGLLTDPPAKNTRGAWKVKKPLLSAKISNENPGNLHFKAATTSKGKGRAKNVMQGILPFPFF